MSTSKKQIFGFVKIACVILFLVELCAYPGLLYLQGKSCIYSPARVSPQEYVEYMLKRDEVLGWPSPDHLRASTVSSVDKSGSRLIPAFPDPDKFPSCASLYGDSFTFGGEVLAEDAWSNVLSKLLGCRVANFGTGGYGTDQAFLRFRMNTRDTSKIVILGFTSENILRNVNQYRTLLYFGVHGEGKFGLKPRFIIAPDGGLQLIPLPNFTYEDFVQMTRAPRRYLAHEYFLPDGTSGLITRAFPYTLTVAKALAKNFHIRARIKDIPWYREFYDPLHSSGALQVTFSILNNFYQEVKGSGRTPVIVIIPTGLDLVYYQGHQRWPYVELSKMLSDHRIPFLDAGPKIISYLNGKDPKTLFYNYHAHFNPEGEKALATVVYEYLKENKINGN